MARKKNNSQDPAEDRPEQAAPDDEEEAEEEAEDVVVIEADRGEALPDDDGAADDDGDRGSKPSATKAAMVPASSRGLARFDALQAYINQARRYPLLSPEEEHDLAVSFQETGDVESARRLVTANLRLVVKIAHEYRKAYRNLLDLIQEGNIGLMHAVKKFDPYRGVKLSSYAAWWIRAYILKFILNNWRMVKIGTTQAQRKIFFNLNKEMDRLKAMGVDNPAPRLLAERLDVPETELRSMQSRLAGGDVSLDAPLRADDTSATSRLDFVTDREPGPDERVENREFSRLLQQKLREFGETLDGRDREIFDLRTVASEPLTLQQIGDRYGITRERSRQIERRMMDRLRDFLRQELGDAVDVALGIGE